MKWRSLAPARFGEDLRPLREQFLERKQLITKYVPAEIRSIYARAIAELEAGGIGERALSRGARAPEFELSDQHGKSVSSRELLRGRTLVLCFIRGRWCPFCVGQLEAMNLILPQIEAQGAMLVALSPQTVHQSSLMAEQHQLRFPLLSDGGNRVAAQFGLSYRVPSYQQAIFERVFINLPFSNGDDRWELPIPATYLVATDGTVLEAWANPDYEQRPEPEEILRKLSRL
jgi:peroxiredoxin